jgi:hypothetical protein
MGFSAQVQSPQTSGQSSGKSGPVGQAVQQVSGQSPSTNPIPSYMSDDFGSGHASNTSFRDAIKPMGKGGAQTNSATSGQPRMGAPNQYPNTVGQWDNTQQQTQRPMQGKGKGA